MKRKYFNFIIIIAIVAAILSGCSTPSAPPASQASARGSDAVLPQTETSADTDSVVLNIAGGWPDCRALDIVAAAFTEKYPNCTVTYEYLQDYYTSLEKRMTGEAVVDIFFTSNIQASDPLLPNTLELMGCEGLDLSNTFKGLIDNFMFREEGKEPTKLYSLPLGAEVRGLYVNKTLLESVGLLVPTDRKSLLAACQVLKDKGYIPFHANPGNFAQILVYPWICNIIANSDDPQAMRDKVNARGEGVSKLFDEPYKFIYTLVENGYYDYKRAQTELDLFNGSTDEDYARDFLNIAKKGEAYEKLDDVGRVAFMPSPLSLKSVIDKTKDDYHSLIDYVFILAPVGEDGGFAYLSPAHGIAANKNSANVDWAVKFLDFLFTPEYNEIFAQAFNVIPNTKEAFSYIHKNYDVADDHISELGEVTFTFDFYGAITSCLIDISKGNNPKYMKANEDGSVSLYPYEYYVLQLEQSLRGQSTV